MQLYTLTLAVLVVGALGEVPAPRIMGGENTTIDKHPYQVSLELKNETTGEFFHNCGGSIIGENWVLTAAHCVRNHSNEVLKIRVGSTYVKERAEGKVHTLSQVIIHPKHDYKLDYDVAVVKVVEPFKFSETVKPITMASETPSTDSPVVVTGWGKTENYDYPDQLLQVELRIMDSDKCNHTYNGIVKDDMVCAGVPGEPIGPCNADSGGPLVYDGKLAGVVSWSTEVCAGLGHPTVFVNVALCKDWVSSTTGVNS